MGAVGFNGQQLRLPPGVDPTIIGIVDRCLDQNQDNRPSFAELLKLLRGMTTLPPAILEVDQD